LPEVNISYRSALDIEICNHSHTNPWNNYDVDIDNELLKKSLPLNLTLQTRGVAALMRKLRCQEDIHIVLLGGSFTVGAGLFRRPSRKMLSWAGRFETWFRSAFPHSKLYVHLKAQGSTTSFYAFRVLQKIKFHADLYIVEYALNDDAKSEDSRKKLAYITEAIIRHVYRNTSSKAGNDGPALVYVDVNAITKWEDNAEKVHQTVCDAYNVPLVSYRRAIFDQFEACRPTRSPLMPPSSTANKKYCVPNPNPGHLERRRFKLWDGGVHPTEGTHQLVAQTLAHYIAQLVSLYNRTGYSDPEVRLPFPERTIFASSQSISHHKLDACPVIMTDFSSLGSEDTSNVTQAKVNFLPRFVSEWTFRVDRPGKPFGWIAESSENDRRSSYSTEFSSYFNGNILIFPVFMMTGSIYITYLSSYENSGVFEVFLGAFDFTANGGVPAVMASDGVSLGTNHLVCVV
jgi:lysophospholipase L1-like esterase